MKALIARVHTQRLEQIRSRRYFRLQQHSLLACTLTILLNGSAFAANFGVSPLRVELSDRQLSGALTLRNEGIEPAVVQVQVMKWSQVDGRDHYAPTTEVLATPPVFTIKNGAAQIIRIGMRRGLDPDQELSYRIFLQEIPMPPREGDTGAKIALRIGLPVFVSPIAVRRMDVRWDLVNSDAKGMTVRATNAGNVHSQILGFKVRDASHPNASSTQDAAYLLPGQSREWTLTGPPQRGADQIHLDLRTDQGEQRVAVTSLKLENAGM